MTIFRYPFTGDYEITSPYGPRDGGFHTGVDFGLPTGTPVLAAADGTITYQAGEDAAGQTITIVHADGMQTRYHHLLSFFYSVDDAVRAGTVIALSDNTGDSTGPHLHFEIRTDPSTPVDPIPYLVVVPPMPTPTKVTPDMLVLVCDGFAPLVITADGKLCFEIQDVGNLDHGAVTPDQRAYLTGAIKNL